MAASTWHPPSALAEPSRCTVVVLTAGAGAAERSLVDGLRDEAARHAVELDVRTVLEAEGDARAVVQAAVAERPCGFVTVGPGPTRVAAEVTKSLPIVATLVMEGSLPSGRPNLTGVGLEFPLAVQLAWLRRILPDRRIVGLLYDPAQNAKTARTLRRLAGERELTLVEREVATPAEIPAALTVIAQRAEVLLTLPDTLVLSRETAQALLVFSFQNRVPFVGLSEAWVKAGALYALERDYRDVGVQAGAIVGRIVNGAAPGGIPLEAPRKVVYVINRRAAEQMKIKLDPSIMEGASRVFE
jgi:putative ABC transport system substrate-binding protein